MTIPKTAAVGTCTSRVAVSQYSSADCAPTSGINFDAAVINVDNPAVSVVAPITML